MLPARPVKGARVGGPKPVGEGKDRDDGRQHDRQHDRKRVDQDGLFGGSDRTLWIEKIHPRPRKWNRYQRRCRPEGPTDRQRLSRRAARAYEVVSSVRLLELRNLRGGYAWRRQRRHP